MLILNQLKIKSTIALIIGGASIFNVLADDKNMPSQCRNIIIDKVWSGAPVGSTAISTPQAIFATYYNKDRYLTVAKIGLPDCRVERKILSSQYGGHDVHNYITMVLDNTSRLHIAGNMHNVPLIYFQNSIPMDIASLQAASMTGSNESSVTYPQFFFTKEKNLFFTFRDGMSGNGTWYVNRLDDHGRWIRVDDVQLYARNAKVPGLNATSPVSAYPSPFELQSDGFFHIAVVWRVANQSIKNARANNYPLSNFSLTYAKTKDFKTWVDAAGNPLNLPLSPDTMSKVVEPGLDSGLVNNAKVSLDPKGHPVIVFTQYVASANGTGDLNGLFAARFIEGRWVIKLLKQSNVFTKLAGRGAIITPNFSALNFIDSLAQVSVTFPNEPSQTLYLDAETFSPTDARPPAKEPTVGRLASSPVSEIPGLEGQTTIKLMGVKKYDGPAVSLRWRTLRMNNDQPFACPPNPAAYCDPQPSDLVFDLLGALH